MKKWFLLLFLGVFALEGAEINCKNGPLQLTFDTKGGGITRFQWEGKDLNHGGTSFNERVMCNSAEGKQKVQLMESFADLEYCPRVIHNATDGLDLEFSVRGIGAFDWLRLTKTYHWKRGTDFLAIDYRLENSDTVPHHAALWVQTFLRTDGPNCYMQNGKRSEAKGDQWALNPAVPVTAVWSEKEGFGVLIRVPFQVSDSFYNWFAEKDPLATMEFITRDLPVTPGKPISFSVQAIYGKNIPQKAARREVKAGPRYGAALYRPQFCASGKIRSLKMVQCRSGLTVKPSRKSMMLKVPRQFTDSVREILLPEGTDLKQLSLCEVANGVADDSRDVPFTVSDKDGKKMLRFTVPGFNQPLFYSGKVRKDQFFHRHDDAYVTMADYTVELRFDRAPRNRKEVKIGEPNLFANGDFSRISNAGNPEDWPTVRTKWRSKWFKMQDGAIAVTRPTEKDRWVGFYEFFRPEPNIRYTVSMRVRSENPVHGSASGSIVFLDADGKELQQYDKTGKKIRMIQTYYSGGGESHGWKTYTHTFYAPPAAVYARLHLMVYGVKDHTVFIDDVKLVPEPYSTVTTSLQSKLRDALKVSWYKPLDLIERNSHAVETPHEKWLNPAAFAMPEVLFLPYNAGTYSGLERRVIVELSQRMEFKYRMIPLLARIANIRGGIMDVYTSVLMPELEPYTLECLKNAPESKVLFVSGVNFKTGVKEPFIQWLREHGKKSSILFHDCTDIPEDLLGTPEELPAELRVMPQMRDVPAEDFEKIVRIYGKNGHRNAVVSMTSAKARRNNPVVPEQELKSDTPVYISRDFPFWDFEYLTLAKTLRYVAGAAPDAVITDVKDNVVTVQASKPVTVKLESRFDTPFRCTVSKTEREITLKEGLNRIPLAVPDGFSGDLIAYLKLYSDGKILDGAGTRIRGNEKVKIALSFPDGVCVPFSKAMPIMVQVTGVSPDAEISAIVEDSDFRQVARASGNGAELKFDFSPKFPYTVLYRVLVSVREQGKEAAAATREICFSGLNEDPQEIKSAVWGSEDLRVYFIYKKIGFEQAIIWYSKNTGKIRLLRNLGMEPITHATGNTCYPGNYNYDKCDVMVRKPCLSDPETHRYAQKRIDDFMGNRSFYDYDIKYHMLGDERYIGNKVCFSPHCLKAFREVLKVQYGSIGKLNEAWGTSYNSFDEAMPVLLKDLKDKRRLGAYVDHKLFISRLFAEGYMGKMREGLNAKKSPSYTGISGTGNPGYSYNWPLVMKQIDFLSCYDGPQRTLARDFSRPGTAIGQWFGGYVLPTGQEGYVSSIFWRDLLQGARLSGNFCPRAGVTGDFLLTSQMEHHAKLLKEARTGIAKLILSSSVQPKVAMVYSQSSLFVMDGTIGRGVDNYNDTLSGWHALLGDLCIDYRFLNAPDLPEVLDSRYKVLILPGVLSLSDAEWNAIRSYAKKGGTVIADMTPGIYDEHGTLRPGKNVPHLAARKFKGGEFRTTDPEGPVMQEQRIGKGRILTMNLSVLGYHKITLGGIGGENSEATSGAAAFCSVLRETTAGELEKAGVARDRFVTGRDGKMRQAETVWREFNGNAVFGIWKFDKSVPVLDPAKGEKVTLTIPRKGHVYDVRNGKYVGFTDSFEYQLHPGGAGVFAVLSEKVVSLEYECNKTVNPGGEVKFSVQCGKGGHVFHCELIDPSGKVRYQRNLGAPDGKADGSFQVALSDPSGTWTLRMKDVASSFVREQKIDVRK